jgi:hypothetical protein
MSPRSRATTVGWRSSIKTASAATYVAIAMAFAFDIHSL